MNFLDKLTLLMEEEGLNKSTLSKKTGIPYTTIDGWFKKGYGKAKLSSIEKLAEHFNTSMDYLVRQDITDRNYNPPAVNHEYGEQMEQLLACFNALDNTGKAALVAAAQGMRQAYEAQAKNGTDTQAG